MCLGERSLKLSREEQCEEIHDIAASDIADLGREAMFRRLQDVMATDDSVPNDVVTSAKASFTLRAVDDDLALLVYDSLLDDELLSSVRSRMRGSRQVTFKSSHVVMEVEVTEGPKRSLTCQVVPPRRSSLQVRHRGGTIDLGEDSYGTFHLGVLPAGPVSLRCISEDERRSSSTSWVSF